MENNEIIKLRILIEKDKTISILTVMEFVDNNQVNYSDVKPDISNSEELDFFVFLMQAQQKEDALNKLNGKKIEWTEENSDDEEETIEGQVEATDFRKEKE